MLHKSFLHQNPGGRHVFSHLMGKKLDPSSNFPAAYQGKHIHTYRGGDLGEEMSHVWGAVVVQRQDLTQAAGSLAPAYDLDFVRTLRSHFALSQHSLLRYVVSFRVLALVSSHYVARKLDVAVLCCSLDLRA